MFCDACGFEVEEDDHFCRRCGRATSRGSVPRQARLCTRSSDGRMLAGVCAGVAQYFEKDITLVRITWTLAALLPPLFPGLAAYVVSWLLMPPPARLEAHEPQPEHALGSE